MEAVNSMADRGMTHLLLGKNSRIGIVILDAHHDRGSDLCDIFIVDAICTSSSSVSSNYQCKLFILTLICRQCAASQTALSTLELCEDNP